MTPHRAAIALGANLGDCQSTLAEAVHHLGVHAEIQVTRKSALRWTEPVGGPPQGPYLNGVVLVETTLEAPTLLEVLLALELKAGRERRIANGPRVLDLDLILYEDLVLDLPGLTLPHPRAHRRAFVLEPLAEVAPDWSHPVLHRTVQELWTDLRSPVS